MEDKSSHNPFSSPEAIEAVAAVLRDRPGASLTGRASMALAAAVKAQPVVALPPCPTCNDLKIDPHTYDDPSCPSCNGSGHDRLIPGSEIREWVDSWRAVTPLGGLQLRRVLDDLDRWLDEREAGQ